MTDVERQVRAPRNAPPSARAMVPHVRATIVRTDATAIALGDRPCETASAPQSNETVTRHARPLAPVLPVAAAREPTSPYRLRLRRCT